MENKEGRSRGLALKERKPFRSGIRSRSKDTWIGRNWSTVLVLVAIILIALFVRSYFVYSTSVDNGFLVAGGSDSYYHQRVIDYVQDTGSHLVHDPLLNYPMGMRNPRPPIYDWSVAVTGQLISGLTGMDVDSATSYALLSSTAIWGALTCIPVFLITRSAFGNRAGLLAALLLALMPSHIQRSVFANADHDAMVLFFVVFAFYFLLRALMTIRGTKWVESWKSRSSIQDGLRDYLSTNQRSLIYSLLGGVCVATVAMIWTGFTYLLVIILIYLLVQVIINRFRNIDSMGELMIVGVMLASSFAIMAPLYWQMDYWSQWFDVPFYLFIGSMIIGALFTVTRDYPWTLTIPIVIAIVAIALVGVYFISPSLFESIISGQGYLVKSKLYSTIAEAQAPGFSNLVLSFGALTFWLAIIGFVWAAIKIPKNPAPHFTFVVVWMGVSMYMAASASRFMFNASPAFAMAAGWMLILIIEAIHFEEIPRALSGFRSNPWATLRKAFKLRHIAGALFLAFLIVAPNVWTAVDAGIPFETKPGYDKQIYSIMPGFMRPADYDSTGGLWYLGAFGYSLPLPTGYWPAAWKWFSDQDSDRDITDRPAFLSWWDYGFEAIQQGQHPTVSDNFQNGYQFAGSFITAGGEDDAIALMIIRIMEGTGVTNEIGEVLEDNGVDADKIRDIMNNPSDYIDEVKSNPDKYGPYDDRLSAENAKYAAARVELKKAGMDGLVNIYSNVREITDKEIGYFAVDGRLFPFSATYNSVFYAPAMLSDRVIDPDTNAPSDYYEIKAVTSSGQLKSIQDLKAGDQVIYYTIVYKDAFYDTMLYRAMMGYSPSDVGKEGQGIPGFSGSLKDMEPMPGWNLTHFKQVYRTAYYLPDGSDTWQAISYEEALYLKEKIDAGDIKGEVDLSASTLTSGTVFLQYYDGAILSGKVTTSYGEPYEGIYVTAVDEMGIPHDVVKTDKNGEYELILPFGDVKVVYSAGTLNGQTLVATELYTKSYNISYEQAMRQGDYELKEEDLQFSGSIVSGKVYWDVDGSGGYSEDDEAIEGVTVVLENPGTGFHQEMITDTEGIFHMMALVEEGTYIYAILDGQEFGKRKIEINPYGGTGANIAVKPGKISGTVALDGAPAPDLELSLTEKDSGRVLETITNENGEFKFEKLLPGNYTIGPKDKDVAIITQNIIIEEGESRENVALSDVEEEPNGIGDEEDDSTTPESGEGTNSIGRTTFNLAAASEDPDEEDQDENTDDEDADKDKAEVSGNISVPTSDDRFEGTLEFHPLNETAEYAEVSSSENSYSISLNPGIYVVYGHDKDNDLVVMHRIVVKSGEDNNIDLTASKGYKVFVNINNVPEPIQDLKITFTDVASYTISGSGADSIWLPQGYYHVFASRIVEEGKFEVVWAGGPKSPLLISGDSEDITIDIDLKRQEIGKVELEWGEEKKRTSAGGSVEYEITVINRGNVDDIYKLSSTSPWEITFSSNDIELSPGESKTITVTIRTPSDAKVDHSPIIIKIKSLENTRAVDEIDLDVDINPNYEADVKPGSEETDGDNVTISVVVKNTGNIKNNYKISISNLDELEDQGWSLVSDLSTLSKNISAGKSATFKLVLERNEKATPNPTIKYTVTSDNIEDISDSVKIDSALVSGSTLDASGQGVQMNSPPVPAVTWVMLAGIALLGAALVIMRVNKGVLGRRRKR